MPEYRDPELRVMDLRQQAKQAVDQGEILMQHLGSSLARCSDEPRRQEYLRLLRLVRMVLCTLETALYEDCWCTAELHSPVCPAYGISKSPSAKEGQTP